MKCAWGEVWNLHKEGRRREVSNQRTNSSQQMKNEEEKKRSSFFSGIFANWTAAIKQLYTAMHAYLAWGKKEHTPNSAAVTLDFSRLVIFPCVRYGYEPRDENALRRVPNFLSPPSHANEGLTRCSDECYENGRSVMCVFLGSIERCALLDLCFNTLKGERNEVLWR